MVAVNKKIKVGFIVEGGSEKVIVESTQFRDFLDGKGYELVTPVIDAKGGGNLLPQNIESFVARFDVEAVDHIFVLTDLDVNAHVKLHQEIRVWALKSAPP